MGDPQAYHFFVPGSPKTAGSKRALPLRGRAGGRPIIVDDCKGNPAWKKTVKAYALAGGVRERLSGPLRLSLHFYLPRPKSHFGKGGLLKPAVARLHHTQKPDTIKMTRAVEDALNGLAWHDDSQIVAHVLQKHWAEDNDGRSGVAVQVSRCAHPPPP